MKQKVIKFSVIVLLLSASVGIGYLFSQGKLPFIQSFVDYMHNQFNPVQAYTGTIEASLVDVSSLLTSPIEEINIKEGMQVKKNEPLLKLRCEDIEVVYNQAKRDENRAATLRKQGTLSQENYEHFSSKLQDISVKKSWCTISSPLEGTVLYSYKDQGELAMQGQKVATIANLNDLWAYIYLSAPEIGKVKLHDKWQGFLPQINQTITLQVIHINSEAEFTPKNIQTREERDRLVYGVKVSILNSNKLPLFPGMHVEVKQL